MLEAQRRFDLLAQRATQEVLQASVDHARAVYLRDDLDPALRAQFEASAAALREHGAMTADTRRAWRALQTRVVDETVSARLANISQTLVLGATSGGEVSAATFAFGDGSHLILVDHGLANLTWLMAQLYVLSRTTSLLGYPPPDQPIELEVAARTLRLAVARVSGGGRAGVNPSLVLTPPELGLAGALVNEMDVFVTAHEAAHILLGHFGADRATLGVVGGSNQLLGRRGDEEVAADLLAVTLQFDDMLSAGEADSPMVELRLMAVQLFLAAVRLYEQSMFVVQPTSHPPAAARWRTIVNQRISRWFDDIDATTLNSAELVRALSDVAELPRLADAAVVHDGLRERLDHPLWSLRDWSEAALLGHILLPTVAQAIEALHRWPGWPGGTDIGAAIAETVGTVLASEPARRIARAAATGSETVSRLDAVQALAGVSDGVNGQPAHAEPFPSWAIAAIVLDAIAAARSAEPVES